MEPTFSPEVQKAMEERESPEHPGEVRTPEEAHSSPMMEFCGAPPGGPGGSEVTLNPQPDEACQLGDRLIRSNPYKDVRDDRNMLPPMARPTKAIMVGLALRGVAQSVLTSLNTQTQNFLEVVEALKQNFSPSKEVQTHLAELKNGKRKAHEPLTELRCDIRRLMRLA